MGATLAVVLVVYFALILGISVWSFARTRTEDDFIAAGREIGPWVGGAVLAATQISAGTMVGTIGR
ncbi:MAG TPA: sodium:proline symporter, partial [Thermoanaerobaculia bacterium]